MLSDQKDNSKSWDDVFKWFESDMKWADVAKGKMEKIEDADELWTKLEEELGKDKAKVIIPLLKGETTEAKAAAK